MSKKKEYILHITQEVPNLETNNLIKLASIVYEENKTAVVEANGGLIIKLHILPEILIEKIYNFVKNISKTRYSNKNAI